MLRPRFAQPVAELLTADTALMRPAPCWNTLYASVPLAVTAGCAEASSRHFTSSGASAGSDCSISATTPVVTAAAIEVPDMVNICAVGVIEPGSMLAR